MPFRIPTTRVELLRVLSAKADVSQVKAAAVWDTMLALAREGLRTRGSFSFPGLGKLERVRRKARRGYNLETGKKIRIPAKEDLVFRVSKIAKDAILPKPETFVREPTKTPADKPAETKPKTVRRAR